MRSTFIFASSSLCLLLTSFAAAQDLTPGKYTGSYNPAQFPNTLVSIVVDITSVENGVITGQGQRHVTSQVGTRLREGCIGGFPLKGTVKGDTIDISAAEKWGPAGDCLFRLRGTVSGNKILGKIGPSDVELSK